MVSVRSIDEEWVIRKVHLFGDKIFENKPLFVFVNDRFFKAIKPRECASNDIAFARDKVNERVELLIIVEPSNDAIRSVVVSGNIWMISMDV